MRTLRLAPTWVALTALCASSAYAQPVEPKNYSAERFRLASDRDGLIDVEWGGVPRHLGWDVAVWIGGSDDPVVVNRVVNGQRERVARLVDHRVGGSLMGSIALFDWIQLGIDLPLILHQQRGDDINNAANGLTDLQSFNVGDLRIIPKLRLLVQRDQGVDLAVIAGVTLPTSGQDDYFGDGLTFAPELALSRAQGGFRLALNFGYRLRDDVQFLNQTVEDELFARLGAGYRFDGAGVPLEIDVTLSGATSAVNPFENANQNPLEVIGGLSYSIAGPVLAFAGGGVGLNEGFGTPDWRVFGGIRISPRGSGDRDGDGIMDDDDQCPDDPEDVDDFADEDGCPDPDNDADRVLDVNDGAPMDPEDHDDFEDEDGVPDPDNDQDGVLDQSDKCPLEPGPMTNSGGPDGDRDGDGINDGADRCPEDPEDVDTWMDEDGCPDPDNDDDGVVDRVDQCPLEPGVIENRGCPDLDTDGDGLVDRIDNCPAEYGPKKNQGCKDKQLVRITSDRIEILEKVYFKTDSAKIRRRSFRLLENVAAVLRAHPEISRIRVEGHTDSRGRDGYNLRLSQRRANSVRRHLVREGVDPDRLDGQGYGETRPVTTNETRKGRAKNRRVEFRIMGGSPDGIEQR